MRTISLVALMLLASISQTWAVVIPPSKEWFDEKAKIETKVNEASFKKLVGMAQTTDLDFRHIPEKRLWKMIRSSEVSTRELIKVFPLSKGKVKERIARELWNHRQDVRILDILPLLCEAYDSSHEEWAARNALRNKLRELADKDPVFYLIGLPF